MADGNNINVSITTGTVLKFFGIVLIIYFVYFVRDIILTVFIAVIFAALIEPLVDRLENKKIPRGLGVIIIYLALLLFLVLTVRMLIPPIIEQVGLLTNNFPSLWQRLVENFQSLKDYSQDQGLIDNIQQGLQGIQSGLTKAAGGVYSFIIAIFANLVNFVLVLVIAFYLVVQRDSLAKMLRAVAPAHYHGYLTDLSGRIQAKIGSWARGQLILGVAIAGLSFVGLLFLLPKYALVLALVAGITELIPYIGPILGAIPAVFLGFTAGEPSLTRGLFVLAFYLLVQQVENNFLVPKVMKKQLGLNPVVTIIAILIGARLAGIIGIILAIPVSTALGVVVKDFIQKSNIALIKDGIGQSGQSHNPEVDIKTKDLA
ncbi:MAG: hypothetical protein A3A24_00895 [Candidatus Buchananbacteria bacterium RIFCSPLOWO2_01_FULL_46_12]|uniref:AI-2E family transporter n=1 Tax=Candidatus Buchananbacteria bacterium RIFCSPLOWO2_01_FULL_46_12 TaxID=1797546 RepID=A0A1G1YMX8_9BACT|nr:MAG: hypothetical protein A3A24_00895 [Candidatus Buchananbacteria bacterium RIFCSPLOWO2_01_FULL_46_12]